MTEDSFDKARKIKYDIAAHNNAIENLNNFMMRIKETRVQRQTDVELTLKNYDSLSIPVNIEVIFELVKNEIEKHKEVIKKRQHEFENL